MADHSSSTTWAWPPPGMFALDTIGSYNPVTSWLSGAMSQIGFINIENMSSGDSDLEKSIIREVGSYGRQLGRIMEALQAVLNHQVYTNWGSDEQQAVKDFTCMAHDIEAHKAQASACDEGGDRSAHHRAPRSEGTGPSVLRAGPPAPPQGSAGR